MKTWLHHRPRRTRLAVLPLVLLGACAGEPRGTGPSESTICGKDEIRIQIGSVARPAAGANGCRLAPSASAEYALVYFDTRAMKLAETSPEPAPINAPPPYVVDVTVEGGTVDSTTSPRTAVFHTHAPHFTTGTAVTGSASSSPYTRARPWTLDERFDLDYSAGEVRTARVVRIYEGGFVVAWYEGDAPDRLPRTLALLDSVMPVVQARALPLLRHTLADSLPRTSAGSGQYLIVLRAYPGSGSQAATGATNLNGEIYAWTWIGMGPFTSHASLGYIVAHEVTHAYQMMRSRGTIRETGGLPVSPVWGVEGGADLIATEMLRRQAGLGLDTNFDWRQPGTDPFAAWWARHAHPGTGEITRGYGDAAGFLRDLVTRRVQAGEPVDDAVREVMRGTLEGWHGADRQGRNFGGLTSRMRARLGAAWNPSEAVLQWTLSHAGDDRTDNPLYQNRAFLRISDVPASLTYGWRPDAVVRSGAAAESGVARATRRYGSPGYMYLRDGGKGVRFTLASDVPGVEWAVLRMR